MTDRPSSTSTDALPVVEALFAEMLMLFGRKFLDQWRGADAQALKSYWARELSAMTVHELARGRLAMKSLDWPPTLPEFVKLCRPPIEPVAAYHQAVAALAERDRGKVGRWPHPAVYWAAVAVGAHDMRSQTYGQIQLRWETALAEELARGSWPAVPAPGRALLAPRKVKGAMPPSVLDVARQLMVPARDDPTGWARRIVERRERGEAIPRQVAAMAEEALGGRGN